MSRFREKNSFCLPWGLLDRALSVVGAEDPLPNRQNPLIRSTRYIVLWHNILPTLSYKTVQSFCWRIKKVGYFFLEGNSIYLPLQVFVFIFIFSTNLKFSFSFSKKNQLFCLSVKLFLNLIVSLLIVWWLRDQLIQKNQVIKNIQFFLNEAFAVCQKLEILK